MSDPRAFVLADALKSLGINPDNDPVYHAKRWIEGRDSDRRERDQAITERDNAAARVAARDMRIADLERDLADKAASLKTAHAALTRICEVIGAPAPCVAEDAVEAVKAQLGDDNDANSRAQKAEAALAEIGRALADAGAPQTYHLDDDTERGIPNPERIRLLGERVHTLRAQVREAADATNYLDALIEAHNALDALNAPRLADGCVLSLAARVRSLLC